MTPDQSTELLHRLLDESGFDPRRVDPGLVWEAFEAWAHYPVESERDEMIVSIGYSEEKALAYLEFVRFFDDFRAEWEGEVALRFTAARMDAPRLAAATECSREAASPKEFLQRVLEMPGFEMALRYPYWQLTDDG